MDVPLKKIQLIEWLTRLQDESLINKIEILRKESLKEIFDQTTPKTSFDLEEKIKRSEEDIKAGKLHSQNDVESFFREKFNT